MIVRELITKIGFKTDTNSINKFEKNVNSAKMSIVALTAAITAAATAVLLFVESAAKAGDRLDKLRDIVGMTTKDYQLLEGAANLAGIENEEFSKSIQLFARSIGMARQGMSQYIKEFAILGINMRDGNGQLKNNKELLLEVADAFQHHIKGVDRNTVAQLLFGRSGAKMINFLEKGRKGIEEATKEFGKYAFILDKKAIKQSQVFRDSQFLLTAAIKGLKNQIGIGLMPVVQKMINETLKWLAANRKMIVSGIIKFFKAMLVAAKALGKTMKFLVSIVKSAVNIWKHLNKAFGNTVKILTVLLALNLIMKIKLIKNIIMGVGTTINFLLSPLGLITASILALILVLDDVAVYMTGGKSLTGELVKKFPKTIVAIKAIIFLIQSIAETIKFTGKIAIFIFSAFEKMINFSLITPLKFVLSLIESIVNAFLSLQKFTSSELGSLIGHGLSAIGFGSKAQPLQNKNNLDFTKTPNLGMPALVGAGATNNRNLNFNTAIHLTVPDGTPAAQQDFISKSAERTFDPIFKRRLREAMSIFPAVEQ